MQNICCGLWVLCYGHGVFKWGQHSDKIKPTFVEHRSKINETLVSGALRTFWHPDRAKVGSRTRGSKCGQKASQRNEDLFLIWSFWPGGSKRYRKSIQTRENILKGHAKNKKCNIFEMRGDSLKNWRAKRFGVYCCIMKKKKEGWTSSNKTNNTEKLRIW